jgi:FKBP-type peptidyl-prolyl cis-trans isomerase (trigger factor)
MTNEKYIIIKKEDLSGGEVEVEIEIPFEVVNSFRPDAIKEISGEIEIDGFRKGTAPEKIVVQKVGEMAVLEKASYRAIYNLIPIILAAEKIDALTFPNINVTKIALDNPLVFKMSVVSMPKISLPDYKKIAASVEKEKDTEVTVKEVDEYIEYIRKQRAQGVAMSEGKKIDNDNLELPPFDDEFVKTLGEFSTVEEFKTKLKENMLEEKKMRATETTRIKIIEAIIEKVEGDMPGPLVEQELERMFGKFKHDIEQFKMQPEEYLAQIKKTEEDLKKEWRTDAVKRVKMNLILPKIAEAEEMKIEEKELEQELKLLKEHDPSINEIHARSYIENVLKNERVFKMLEIL